MQHRYLICGIVIFAILILSGLPVHAEVTVDPRGLTISVAEDPVETEFTLVNQYEQDVAYRLTFQWLPEDEEEEQRGPRRDEPGEILQRVGIPYSYTIGLALDTENNWMWSLEWNQRRLYAIDMEEYEVQVNIGTNVGLVGLFYRDGILYAGGYAANGLVYRYDLEGRLINQWRLPINLHYHHFGGNDEYMFTVAYPIEGGHGDVHVWDDNIDEVAVIDCSEGIGDEAWGVEWVSDHQFGQLWLTSRDHFFQYYVDEEWNAELIQTFETVNTGHTGLAHDEQEQPRLSWTRQKLRHRTR